MNLLSQRTHNLLLHFSDFHVGKIFTIISRLVSTMYIHVLFYETMHKLIHLVEWHEEEREKCSKVKKVESDMKKRSFIQLYGRRVCGENYDIEIHFSFSFSSLVLLFFPIVIRCVNYAVEFIIDVKIVE